MNEIEGGQLPRVEAQTTNPQERNTWRSNVRSAMLAAGQLPGGGTDVNDAKAKSWNTNNE